MTEPLDPAVASGGDTAPVEEPTAPLAPVVPAPPPPPLVRFSPPKGGVPRALVAVLAPVLAIVMFTAGLATGQVISPSGAPAPSVAAGRPASGARPKQPSVIAVVVTEHQEGVEAAEEPERPAAGPRLGLRAS